MNNKYFHTISPTKCSRHYTKKCIPLTKHFVRVLQQFQLSTTYNTHHLQQQSLHHFKTNSRSSSISQMQF
jgi:hypothetical protein